MGLQVGITVVSPFCTPLVEQNLSKQSVLYLQMTGVILIVFSFNSWPLFNHVFTDAPLMILLSTPLLLPTATARRHVRLLFWSKVSPVLTLNVIYVHKLSLMTCQHNDIFLGLKQEEDLCPYTWLPFTREQKIQDHRGCWYDGTLPFTRSLFVLILPAAMLPQIHYTKINVTFLEKFGPVFATEGESASLTATVTLNPNLANLQPEAQWYRDGNDHKEALYVNYTCATCPGDQQARSEWYTVTVTAVENHNVMESTFIAH